MNACPGVKRCLPLNACTGGKRGLPPNACPGKMDLFLNAIDVESSLSLNACYGKRGKPLTASPQKRDLSINPGYRKMELANNTKDCSIPEGSVLRLKLYHLYTTSGCARIYHTFWTPLKGGGRLQIFKCLTEPIASPPLHPPIL